MKISVEAYIDKVYVIYDLNPEYSLGHDGYDGKCDCIGMVKGALRRNGVEPSGMSGTNYAVRYTLKNVKEISSVSELRVGDVVLKGRGPTDPGYDLPDKYRYGGKSYNGDLTDYYHIGTVTKINPLEITHMTSPHALKDYKLGKWKYVAKLPWVNYGAEPAPDPDPKPTPGGDTMTAIVYSENGKPVNMRATPSLSGHLITKVPCGSEVTINMDGEEWSLVSYQNDTGYMMTQFLKPNGSPEPAPSDDYVMVPRSMLEDIVEKIYSIIGRG